MPRCPLARALYGGKCVGPVNYIMQLTDKWKDFRPNQIYHITLLEMANICVFTDVSGSALVHKEHLTATQ